MPKIPLPFSTQRLRWVAGLVTRAQWERSADHYNPTQEMSPRQPGRGKQTETRGINSNLYVVISELHVFGTFQWK